MHVAQAIAKCDKRTDKGVPMWFFASLSQVFVPAPIYSLFKPEFQHHKPVNQVPIQSLNILHIF